MTRWHLIDRSGEPAIALRAAAAAGEPVIVIGDERLALMARSAGVVRGEYVPAPLGRTALAARAVRRALRRIGAATCVAWSDRAAALVSRRSGVEVIELSAAAAEPVWQLGDETDVEERRAALREGWGVDDSTACVLTFGGDEVSGDAYDAAMAVGLAREARLAGGGGELRLVVRPSQPGRVHAWSLWRDFGLDHLLIGEPRAVEPWAILPAIDAVLDLGPEPTAWRRWIEDRGLPLIGPAWLPSRCGPVADVRQLAGALTAGMAPPHA